MDCGSAQTSYLHILDPIKNHALRVPRPFKTLPASSLCVQANEHCTYGKECIVQHTEFSQTLLISDQSRLQDCLQFNIQSFPLFQTWLPTLGIYIAPDLEKIGFNWNTVSLLSLSATPQWLLRHPVIVFILQIKLSPLQRFLKSGFMNSVAYIRTIGVDVIEIFEPITEFGSPLP